MHDAVVRFMREHCSTTAVLPVAYAYINTYIRPALQNTVPLPSVMMNNPGFQKLLNDKQKQRHTPVHPYGTWGATKSHEDQSRNPGLIS
jgi:hypothetical protein